VAITRKGEMSIDIMRNVDRHIRSYFAFFLGVTAVSCCLFSLSRYLKVITTSGSHVRKVCHDVGELLRIRLSSFSDFSITTLGSFIWIGYHYAGVVYMDRLSLRWYSLGITAAVSRSGILGEIRASPRLDF
jgi:hypothetical protein